MFLEPVIQFFNDRTLFWNPGHAFASADELLEPGEKEVRNPRIVAAFRRIGLSEQAGTGIRSIFSSWQQLGHVPPVIGNDRARKAFEFTLLKEELLSREQLLLQASLGASPRRKPRRSPSHAGRARFVRAMCGPSRAARAQIRLRCWSGSPSRR